MRGLKNNLKELLRYPSAIAGLLIISLLVVISIFTLIRIPYSEAVRLWRGGEEIWYLYPKNASPAWVNFFRKDKLPETVIASSLDEDADKTVEKKGEDLTQVLINFPITFDSGAFPQELTIYFTSQFEEKRPHISMKWFTPDGREINMGSFSISEKETVRVSQDKKLERKLGGLPPEVGLFAVPGSDPPEPLIGDYRLEITGTLFENEGNIDAEMVLQGEVYGLAGTDHLRRDLMIGLLWGMPVALAFGLIAALGTTITTMIIAAYGVWYGGWVDELIQRITEINMVLPFLPILIMIGTFYSRSIWVILGATIVLSIFGSAIKNYRAIFMQVKESGYIDAARAYGASNSRIIIQYLIPRIIPVLIPSLVTAIPAYVFLEASLAVLGLGDPTLPTWGKIINDARSNGALYQGLYYWVLQPSILLMITGLAFAMVGFALDRVFNPRLRGM